VLQHDFGLRSDKYVVEYHIVDSTVDSLSIFFLAKLLIDPEHLASDY
jgi:hypothetical protein